MNRAASMVMTVIGGSSTSSDSNTGSNDGTMPIIRKDAMPRTRTSEMTG